MTLAGYRVAALDEFILSQKQQHRRRTYRGQECCGPSFQGLAFSFEYGAPGPRQQVRHPHHLRTSLSQTRANLRLESQPGRRRRFSAGSECRLLGVEHAYPQASCPGELHLFFGPRVSTRLRIGCEERLGLRDAGGRVRRPRCGEHGRSRACNCRLPLAHDAVPVVHNMQPSTDPAEILGLPVSMPDDDR